jgi:hypothetical protein
VPLLAEHPSPKDAEITSHVVHGPFFKVCPDAITEFLKACERTLVLWKLKDSA